MTLEQIRGMSDEEMSAAIAGTQGFEIAGEDERNSQYHFSSEKGRIYGFLVDKRGRRRGKLCQIPNYTHDLNAAMRLVPVCVGIAERTKKLGGFYDAFTMVSGIGGGNDGYDIFKDYAGKPVKFARHLCEAYLLWKAGDK